MENKILEELKKYFENTSEEQIKKDWAKYDYLDNVGMTADEYLELMEENKQFITND